VKNLAFGGLDFENPAEIERLARIHESAPADWISGFQLHEDRVSERAEFLRKSQGNEDVCILTVRNEVGEVVGFHWLQRTEKYGRTCARIDSLWVDEAYRRQGIAQALKERGEAWAKSIGAAFIVTEVFYVNKTMIDLNLKLGFEARQVEMIKDL
jgi:GNAT superfamily N-acetyltransferase